MFMLVIASHPCQIYFSYLGEDDANYRGKRISGDDAFLNIAIQCKDVKVWQLMHCLIYSIYKAEKTKK